MKNTAQPEETLCIVSDSAPEQFVNLGHLADSIKVKDFGILLMLSSLIIVLPIGIIPGVSPLCAFVTLFVSCHIFSGRQTLWLPQRIRRVCFNYSKITGLLQKAEGIAKKMSKISKPRLTFMTEGLAGKLVAVTAIILAAATILLGFIPLLGMILMLPVVFFGLGSYMQDGLVTSIGWGILGIAAGIAGFFA